MLNKRFFIIFLICICGCASQKSLVTQNDNSLLLLTGFTKEASSNKKNFTEQEIAQMTTTFDSLCNAEIKVAPTKNLEKMQQQLDKTTLLDSVLLQHARQQKNDRLATSLRELKFRTLVKSQERLAEAFDNKQVDGRWDKKSNEDYEVHGNYVFEQRVSLMLPYIQANQRNSMAKSKLLTDLISSLPQMNSVEERKRCWLAIERMLQEIDVKKSEVGYQPFQRSAHGIYTKPGQIIEQLQLQHAQETNEEILAFSSMVINKLADRLHAKVDDKFLQQVQESEELNRKFLEELRKEHEQPVVKDEPQQIETAGMWFDKGFNTHDDLLKVEYYTRAIALKPEFAEAYANRGNAFKALGRLTEALADFDHAIAFNPEFEPVFINRGNVFQLLNQHESAIADYTTALEFEPNYTVAYLYRGNSLKNLGRNREAIDDFSKAIELEPRLASAYNYRGDVYRAMEKYQAAAEDYTTAIAIDPQYAVAYNNRGVCYRYLKKFKQAINDHERAIQIMPDFVDAHYNLGCVYWETKNWHAVIHSWEKCLMLDPNYKNAATWLPKAKENLKRKAW